MSYKTTDGLMRHLREKGIEISGSNQKRQLINTGYFHGYKGYRFFNDSSKPIPFSTYRDVYATIKYDSEIKALFYSKIMFIETAVKNIALERILKDANSENIQDMLKRVIIGYHDLPHGSSKESRKKAQSKKLKLENDIQSSLLNAYGHDNPKVVHFYNKAGYHGVPLWALFEILTLGDFAHLLSRLKFNTRDHIVTDLGMRISSVDTNRELIYKYLYALKDLRNAIAHNSVVFDTRFRAIEPTPAMKKCLMNEFALQYINFKTIGDYLVLICYYLNLLKVPKAEIKCLIKDFEKITDVYIDTVDSSVAGIVIHPDLQSRMNILKKSF